MKRLLVLLILAAATVDVVVGVAAPTAEPAPTKIAPRVAVNGIWLGGLTSEQARSTLRSSLERPLRLSYGERRWLVRPARLGATAAVDEAVARALAARPGQRISLDVTASMPALRRYVRWLNRRFSEPARDAELVGLVNLAPSISEGAPGVAVRQDAMVRSLAQA
ncbi:MAG: hypothetical protein M3M94_04390, partial [Actinomycetota bacterium]|nr:hypothetical protein [Actinomycetota bacterium]